MAKINLNAWREIIARIFDGFEPQFNVSPDWLINPETNRRLKLDLLYPEIGVAIRFEGLKARQKRHRASLEEELQEKDRAAARDQVCKAHGISLATLNLSSAEPKQVLVTLEETMSRATRLLAKDEQRTLAEKTPVLEKLSRARSKASEFRRKIRDDKDLDTYSALWYDRQYQDSKTIEQSVDAPMPALKEGMHIEHTHFGDGLVEKIEVKDDDNLVTIDFIQAGRRTFLASLLGDKLASSKGETKEHDQKQN